MIIQGSRIRIIITAYATNEVPGSNTGKVFIFSKITEGQPPDVNNPLSFDFNINGKLVYAYMKSNLEYGRFPYWRPYFEAVLGIITDNINDLLIHGFTEVEYNDLLTVSLTMR
jgi:hypothetical protein